MKKLDVSQWPSSMARSITTFGDHWNLTIIMQSLMGARRYEDFQKPTNISRSILHQRLNGLIELGVFKKVKYQIKPQRYWHSICGNQSHPKIVCAKCEEPFNALNVAVAFITPEAIEFALKHCGNPVRVKN